MDLCLLACACSFLLVLVEWREMDDSTIYKTPIQPKTIGVGEGASRMREIEGESNKTGGRGRGKQ